MPPVYKQPYEEPAQQLTSGAVPLTTAFNGRFILANRAGAQLGYNPAYSAVSGNPYCVIKSSAHKREAMRLLNFMLTDAKADAACIEATNSAMPNTAALALAPQAVLDTLPTSPALKDTVFVTYDAWWTANLADATRTFKERQLAG